ncbi:MAG: DUF2752 domain-containing protein [Candidatus Dormibacteraeota bacterium]|nr:DUF2752 domain-containing protein [Candidatus Dormibacteraeota bacterium]
MDVARRVLGTRRREVAIGAVAVCVIVMAGDPHSSRSRLPMCPVKLVTGLDCPGCGGLRLTHDLLHGDLRAAMHDNAFLLTCTPVLAALALRSFALRPGAAPAPVPPRVAYTLASAAMLWMFVRNLPGWPLKPITRA